MNALTPDAVLARVRDLPALPAVVLELIASLADDRYTTQQLATKIASDPALSAKTLRLANSSFYGRSRDVTSIADATTVLGLRTLRNIATVAGLTAPLGHLCGPVLDFDAFWRHCIATALCSAALAKALQLDDGMAFTFGLLHDVGRLALASGFADAYADVIAYQRSDDCPAQQAEQAVLGTDHAVVGGLMAEHWHFAPQLVLAVGQHHAPLAPVDGRPSLADLVHVADNVVHALGLSQVDDDLVPPLSLPAWARLALDEDAWRTVFAQTESQHRSVCSTLLN